MRAVCYYASGVLERARVAVSEEARSRWRRRINLLTPIVKGWVTEFAYESAGTGVQIAGGMGYMNASPAARCLLEARVHTIYEGTTGIQALDLALRKFAKDGGAAAGDFIMEVRSTWPAAAQAAGLHDAQPDIGACLSTFKAATDWIVAKASADLAAVQGIAVHYLMMWGIALGSWLTTSRCSTGKIRSGKGALLS